MTGPGPSDPGGEQPVPPPSAPPAPPAAPSAAPSASNTWTAMSAPVTAGPAGYVYADVPNRAIAYIIDAIILAIIGVIVAIILGAIGLSTLNLNVNSSTFGQYNFVAGVNSALILTANVGAPARQHPETGPGFLEIMRAPPRSFSPTSTSSRFPAAFPVFAACRC